jgi:hypothetical protein
VYPEPRKAEQTLSINSGRHTMAANIQTFTKTITTVSTVEALPVDEATTDEIRAFLLGSGYRYSTAEEQREYRADVVGFMIQVGAFVTVRTGDFIPKLDGQVRHPVTAAQLAERYIN